MTREDVKMVMDEFNTYFMNHTESLDSKESLEMYERYNEAKRWKRKYELEDEKQFWTPIEKEDPKSYNKVYFLIYAERYKCENIKSERWKKDGSFQVVRTYNILDRGVAKGDDGYIYQFQYWAKFPHIYEILNERDNKKNKQLTIA